MKLKRLFAAVLAAALFLPLAAACSAGSQKKGLGNGWEPQSSMELAYAKNFSVDYYDGGYKLLSLSDGTRCLTVPEGKEAPDGIDADIMVLKQPVNDIYLCATSAMCLFDALDALDSISLSGSKSDDWYIDGARKAMESGKMTYAGKYSEPDYELILSSGCRLAVESTMIDHSPEVKEKLEELGIPVITEQSSGEEHPLGRTEWIKFYGALLDKEDEAEKLFSEQAAFLDKAASFEDTGKTVAFFYINSSGYAIARRSGDYVTKMIELAGGEYIFKNLGDPEKSTSTVPLEMEEFYSTAKDADYIIYNSAIDGNVATLDELIAKNNLLGDFKAVKEGNVWCTSQNMFQQSMQIGRMILDIHGMLTGEDASSIEFLYKLE